MTHIEAVIDEKVEKMVELRKLMKKCRLRLLSDGELWYIITPTTTMLEPCSAHGDVDELEDCLNSLLESYDLLEHKPTKTEH